MGLENIYTKKQIEVLKSYKYDDWKILINYGAKRSGKTVIDNDLFLYELKRVKSLADDLEDSSPMYILAGYSSKTIQNNVLQELSKRFGLEFKFDKHGSFELFGVKVVTAYTGSVAGVAGIRGMTSYGAYINEASVANREVFDEIISRCSIKGARIICDTNPDNPEHWLKKEFIDNHDEKAKIKSFHFTIDDNTFLDKEYIESRKANTPTGMLYDRNILGLWVAGEGMVYKDFNKETMSITKEELPDNLTYYCGVDWGYEHFGSIVVLADDEDGNVYLVEEHSYQYKEIDDWVEIAKDIQNKYGWFIHFWCDSARPEYVYRFKKENLKAYNANKAKLSGIEAVARKIKQDKFRVVKENTTLFYSEIYQYVWNGKTGEPIKENDDCLDAVRYAVYNQHQEKTGGIKFSGGIY